MTDPLSSKPESTRAVRVLQRFLQLTTGMLLCAGLAWAPGATARQDADLVNLINEYRNSPGHCEGRHMEATGPLAPSSRLAGVDPASDGGQAALQQSGYQASVAQFVQLSGPENADQALEMIRARFCQVLRSERYAEIGVSRSGNEWQIVLARPLVSAEFRDREWPDVGQQVLSEVNLARREARTCGKQEFKAAHPLTWDARLARAALEHSRYMAENAMLTHAGPEGGGVEARVDLVNYEWDNLGENVAMGQSSPEQVVAAWLHSPEHCANIMNPEFTDMGAAYEMRAQSSIYWTQVLGSER